VSTGWAPMLGLLFALMLVWLGGAVQACSVPVFRYALERWEADPYRLNLATTAPQSEAGQARFSRPSLAALKNSSTANLDFEILEESTVAPFDPGTLSVPSALELLYPRTSGIVAPAWVGLTTESNLDRLTQSPARTEIGRRLLGGDSAVWVLLESGDARADEAAAHRITSRLKELEQELEIEPLDPDDIAAGLVTMPVEGLQVAFSMLRVSRSEPDEDVLVHMLLGLENDLREFSEPIAFPVFGRGRVLYALVGKGINDRTIRRACSFLTGPCSCQAKELNPGVDLLMAIDWDSQIERSAITTRELPSLTGLAAFDEQRASELSMQTQSPGAGNGSYRRESGGEPIEPEQGFHEPSLEPGTRSPTDTATRTSTAGPDQQGSLGLLTLVMMGAGGLVLLLLVAGSLFLMRRRP